MTPGGVGLPAWGRLSTAQRRLDPNWEFVNPEAKEALAFKDAYEKVAGGDPRPILLLRDCAHSEKDLTKVATFTDDERVALGMSWFHLVRLHKDAVKPEHPLHSLVGSQNAHMVVFTRGGADRVDLVLMPTANELWSQMVKGLKKDFKKSPEDSVSKWRKILTEFDILDKEYARLKGEEYRKGSADEDLERKLEAVEEKRQKLTADERKVKDLEFRDAGKKMPAPDESWRDDLLKKKLPAKPAGG